VSKKGEFTAQIPADTPAFVVLRDSEGGIVAGWNRGYVSIAQGNAWAHPGQTVTCVGCHFGHVSGSLQGVMKERKAGWTNVAPYAKVTVSSFNDTGNANDPAYVPERINDRRGWVPAPAGAPTGGFQDQTTGWMSARNKSAGEWVQLQWNRSMLVSKVHLVGPEPVGGDRGGFGNGGGPYHITSGTLRLYSGTTLLAAIGVGQVEPLSNGGTWVTLQNATAIDRMTFTIDSTTGVWYYTPVAALSEIEVTGMSAQ
jgi:hypothetical protein